MTDTTNRHRVALTVNGAAREGTCEARTSLADFLRHDLGLTGTHVGCEHGVCGACTVLVDGAAVRGCLMLAVQAAGRTVETVEGLAGDGPLSVLQQAFVDHHALQCGFCTPGVLMTLTEVLRDDPAADEDTIRDALSGNLCRCTGYQNIVDAALAAAAALREGGRP
jgi:carbon-monoxide dehydrogenase small subunit